jgi:hypothetical protein
MWHKGRMKIKYGLRPIYTGIFCNYCFLSGGIMDVPIKGTSSQNIPNSSCSHASIVSDMYWGGGLGWGGGRVSHKNEKNLPTKSKEKYL